MFPEYVFEHKPIYVTTLVSNRWSHYVFVPNKLFDDRNVESSKLQHAYLYVENQHPWVM